jgi:hypothetical protein
MQWFDHFAFTAESSHKRGARALSQYAFVNRDICWEELEWKGKHGQSPAVVATKPHYFRDLDVLQTVENFLEYVPDFWSSDEFANSVKDGEVLQIDIEYFVDQFSYLMYEENSKDVWRAVEEFFMDEQFSSLCQHLLIHLDEQRLLDFFRSLGKLISKSLQCKELTFQCCWLEVLLSAHGYHISLDDLVLLNCVISKRKQLWWLMNDEEQAEERGQMEEFLKSANQLTDADHFSLMAEFAEREFPDALKWIGIQSWIIFSDLSKECKSADSCESLFSCNKIEFHKADGYSLVQSDGYSVSHISDADDEDLTRSVHKSRKKNRKRKKPRYESDENRLDQLIEVPFSSTTDIIRSQCRSWRLSTDAFSASWDIVYFICLALFPFIEVSDLHI